MKALLRGKINKSTLNNEPLTFPAYMKGFNCFEIMLATMMHNDIFCLAWYLAAWHWALTYMMKKTFRCFRIRLNPVQYNPRIHPTISTLITEMTELDRHKRIADLYDIIQRLKNYRDYDPAKQTDLSNIAGWVNKELKERSQFILNKLRNRLFDTSRRNRLLYYKPNMRFVNLHGQQCTHGVTLPEYPPRSVVHLER